MSDYTPTTEEVREVYENRLIMISQNKFELIDVVQANAEFDRWLAEVKAQAVAEWLAERMAAFEKADLEDYEQEETE